MRGLVHEDLEAGPKSIARVVAPAYQTSPSRTVRGVEEGSAVIHCDGKVNRMAEIRGG